MTIFSRLFGKKAPATVEQTITDKFETSPLSQVPQIDKSLFIEDRHPKDITRSIEASHIGPIGILEDLKERDYFSLGRRHGYEDRSIDVMEEHVDIIASEFKEAFYAALEDLDEKIDDLAIYLTDEIKKVMPHQYEEIHTKQDKLVKQKREILSQIDLAVLGEGYIERSVRLYRAGFKKGFAFFAQEELLTPHSKITKS